MGQTALKKIAALEDKRNKLLEEAKSEIVKKIELELNALAALGFDYKLTEGRTERSLDAPRRNVNGSGDKAKLNRGRVTDSPCSICGFKTERPHDARAHRWQEPKTPFSKKELNERGLRRVR